MANNSAVFVTNPWDDATWILTSAFVIFTMQSGFSLLESGSATVKNEVNIMVKNAVDVIFGGLSFYLFGYVISFGDPSRANGFIGLGFSSSHKYENERINGTFYNDGNNYTQFIFQLAFSTTTTTIVSGAMVERTRLEAYIIFSFLNTFVSSFPVHWVWSNAGFLKKMGVIDIAGGGPVHIVGGVTGLVATIMLKPRHRRYKTKRAPPMGSPTNAILGMFMLWWGWLGFNCGSTQGVTGNKWALAARSAVATINSSIGGGITGITLSYVTKRRKFDIRYLLGGVLGALVSITAMCTLCPPKLAILIGVVGGVVACAGIELMDACHVDDPVGVVPVHFFCGTWSLIAAGLFVDHYDEDTNNYSRGLFMGGGIYLLSVQLFSALCICVWCVAVSAVILKTLSVTVGLRFPYHEELLGADLVEHSIGDRVYDKRKGRLVERPKWRKVLSKRNVLRRSSLSIKEAEEFTRRRRTWNINNSKVKKICCLWRKSQVGWRKEKRKKKINSIYGNDNVTYETDESENELNNGTGTRVEEHDINDDELYYGSDEEEYRHGDHFFKHRRTGARRIGNNIPKWQEVLGLEGRNSNVLDYQRRNSCRATTSRNVATQTIDSTEFGVYAPLDNRSHRNVPRASNSTTVHMHRVSEQVNDTLQVGVYYYYDSHSMPIDWTSLVEHFV